MAQDVFRKTIAMKFKEDFIKLYEGLKASESKSYSVSPEQVGARALKSVCLNFLMSLRE